MLPTMARAPEIGNWEEEGNAPETEEGGDEGGDETEEEEEERQTTSCVLIMINSSVTYA